MTKFTSSFPSRSALYSRSFDNLFSLLSSPSGKEAMRIGDTKAIFFPVLVLTGIESERDYYSSGNNSYLFRLFVDLWEKVDSLFLLKSSCSSMGEAESMRE